MALTPPCAGQGQQSVKVGVEGSLGDIAVNVYLRVFVALPDNAPLPLLKVGRTPRAVEMVQGDELLLEVGACSHTLGAAQQDTHLTAPYFAEQVFLLYLALGVVDEGDLVFGNTKSPPVPNRSVPAGIFCVDKEMKILLF